MTRILPKATIFTNCDVKYNCKTMMPHTISIQKLSYWLVGCRSDVHCLSRPNATNGARARRNQGKVQLGKVQLANVWKLRASDRFHGKISFSPLPSSNFLQLILDGYFKSNLVKNAVGHYRSACRLSLILWSGFHSIHHSRNAFNE